MGVADKVDSIKSFMFTIIFEIGYKFVFFRNKEIRHRLQESEKEEKAKERRK